MVPESYSFQDDFRSMLKKYEVAYDGIDESNANPCLIKISDDGGTSSSSLVFYSRC